jgi:hypothetical protein
MSACYGAQRWRGRRRNGTLARLELNNEPEGPGILDEVVVWLRERARLCAQPNTASGERLER